MLSIMFGFRRKRPEISKEQWDNLSVNYNEKRFNVYNDLVKANQEQDQTTAIYLVSGKVIFVDMDSRLELVELDMVKVYNHRDRLESIFPIHTIVCVENGF